MRPRGRRPVWSEAGSRLARVLAAHPRPARARSTRDGPVVVASNTVTRAVGNGPGRGGRVVLIATTAPRSGRENTRAPG